MPRSTGLLPIRTIMLINEMKGKVHLQRWCLPVLLLLMTGCDEAILNAITRRVHPRPLDSPPSIAQFHTNNPQSQIRSVGWREIWPGVKQDMVWVTDFFVARPQTIITEEVRGWVNRYGRGNWENYGGRWEWVENLSNEESLRAGADTYHLLVYLDRQPNVLVAKGEWDSTTNQIRVEVYRASDLPK